MIGLKPLLYYFSVMLLLFPDCCQNFFQISKATIDTLVRINGISIIGPMIVSSKRCESKPITLLWDSAEIFT